MQGLSTSGHCVNEGSRAQGQVGARNILAASAGLDTASCMMGVGQQLLVPSLKAVSARYHFSEGGRTSPMLAARLLEADLARPGDWKRAGKDANAFLQASLTRWVVAHGAERIRRRFDLSVTLSDRVDLLWEPEYEEATTPSLNLIVAPESAAYVVFGPTLELLEEVHPRVAATFFHRFIGALNRWVRVYDGCDAAGHVEAVREWYEQDQETEQYELPDVEGATPASVKLRPLGGRRALELAGSRPELRSLVKGVLELEEVSRLARRPDLADELREQLADAGPALPSVLAVFRPHDAIEACWDDESQSMLELTPEPNLIVPLDPDNSASVCRAFATLGVACRTLAAASQLIDLMPGNDGGIIERH
jgi:hypothetical protein